MQVWKNFTTFKNPITSKKYNNGKNLFLLFVVVVRKVKTNTISLEIFCKYPCLCHTKLLLNIPYVKKTLLKENGLNQNIYQKALPNAKFFFQNICNRRPYSRQYVSRYVIYMISGDLRLEGYLYNITLLIYLLIVSAMNILWICFPFLDTIDTNYSFRL